MNETFRLIKNQARSSTKRFIDANHNMPENKIRKKIDQLVVQLAKINSIELTNSEKEEIIQAVALEIVGTMEDASNIFNIDKFDHWLDDVKSDFDNKYWEDYHFHLFQKPYYTTGPNGTLTKMGNSIEFILSMLANPNGEPSSRKGMVVGNVQSGKTSHYIGLISKAADAGYKVVIVITGMLEDLRKQTQTRTEEGFLAKDVQTGESVGVGLERLRLSSQMPNCVTTREKDFTKSLAVSSGYTVESFKEAFVLVIKKNASILRNLNEWIEDDLQRIGRTQVDTSVLIIDDEADNASINTKANSSKSRRRRKLDEVEDNANYEPSRINGQIRSLIKKFEICSYVAYTATPFANIFISPKTKDEMYREDLFPRHFVQYINPPDNYFGPSRIFLEKEFPNFLKIIPESEIDGTTINSIPLKHKKDFSIEKISPKLEEAINSFFISSTVKKLEGFEKDHTSMLINASTFTLVQISIKRATDFYVKNLAKALKYRRKEEIQILKTLWEKDYVDYHDKYEWSDIENLIYKIVDLTKVIVINRSKESEKLDYENWPSGRTLIVVGGFSLSRGLTLEGLIVSYFVRNSKMYDSILQMGRWFGYRDGYENLCRLYLPSFSIKDFEHISESVEELAEDIQYMQSQGRTPLEFALRVRADAYDKKLKITSRNKMGAGEKRLRSFSYSGKLVQNYAFDRDTISHNWNVVESSILEIIKSESNQFSRKKNQYVLFKNIPGQFISSLTEEYKFSDDNSTINKQTLLSYIKKRLSFELSNWDIIIDSNLLDNKKETIDFAGISIAPVGRSVSVYVGNKYENLEFDLEKLVYLSPPRSRNICTPDISLISYDDIQINEAEDIKKEQKKRIRTINLLANIHKKPALIITLCKPTYKEEYLLNKDDEDKKNQVQKLISEMPYVASLSYLFPRSDVAEELIEVFVNADVDDLYGEDLDYEDYYGDD